jgi:hypothetical protein
MPRKTLPKKKRTDPEQLKRFLEAAKEAQGSKNPADFERALKKVAVHRAKVKSSG